MKGPKSHHLLCNATPPSKPHISKILPVSNSTILGPSLWHGTLGTFIYIRALLSRILESSEGNGGSPQLLIDWGDDLVMENHPSPHPPSHHAASLSPFRSALLPPVSEKLVLFSPHQFLNSFPPLCSYSVWFSVLLFWSNWYFIFTLKTVCKVHKRYRLPSKKSWVYWVAFSSFVLAVSLRIISYFYPFETCVSPQMIRVGANRLMSLDLDYTFFWMVSQKLYQLCFSWSDFIWIVF